MEIENLFKGFSKLTSEQRYKRLVDMDVITKEDVEFLKHGGVDDLDLAEHFIENSIGYFQLPLGVATNFNIDGVDRVIPMAVEETSIIAAASKTARWIRENGTIQTSIRGASIIGQIQIARCQNPKNLVEILKAHRDLWIQELNREVASSMVSRGGGVEDIQLRFLSRQDGDQMAVFHVHFNPCDAMGANVINQICEYLKNPIEELSHEKVTMCILSNLVDTKITVCEITLNGIDPDMGERIMEASLFAESDPYRAATNNKGVLNGIDPVLIATGNDWRAVEAGIHAYACKDGQYRSITRWRYQDGVLKGTFEAPLIVGTVGGVTSLHPTAKMCLRMLKLSGAGELSRLCAAVGLVQNLGALKALTTVGIIEGHMKLHIKNLTLGVGASETESKPLQKKLEQLLAVKKRITHTDAWQLLQSLREPKALSENRLS